MTNAAAPAKESAQKPAGAIFHDDLTPPLAPAMGEDEYSRTTRFPLLRKQPLYIRRGAAVNLG